MYKKIYATKKFPRKKGGGLWGGGRVPPLALLSAKRFSLCVKVASIPRQRDGGKKEKQKKEKKRKEAEGEERHSSSVTA